LSSGEYLPGSLQGKISSDSCLKKEQMVVSAIVSTPQISQNSSDTSLIWMVVTRSVRIVALT
ncbi:hypothetical protein, partial [Escherichia coli]|uniref:hypothetical protein n=1 Tax=Escherichia coli TaxID=562 RepID=UPI001BB4813D